MKRFAQITLPLCLLFNVSLASYSQESWHLPFSTIPHSTEKEIRLEIELVEEAFDEKNEALDINQKKVSFTLEEDYETIARVYTTNNKLVALEQAISISGGSRRIYFDKEGNERLIIDFTHSSFWINQTYYYLTDDKIWEFVWGAEVTYPNDDGIGKIEGEEEPIHKRISFEGSSAESYYYNKTEMNRIRNKLLQKANAASIDPAAIRFLKGELHWKYPIIMELNLDKHGRISGRYRYKSSTSDLQLSGLFIEERFELLETDEEGNKTGIFRGRFVDKSNVEGWWFKPDLSSKLYLELKLCESYSF